ncbi:ABC transporter substrate-binding protein [Methylobacterium platani]|uniref:ABC transporter permease n=2 Tax=Methylobacterium platani TaxID=427683 RepID=A0A179RZK2_9HYPH|nr:ABC transporter substrate-binding protein [Methylobacterium platani]KMO19921.1 ABC transporter permease [Methylobacterium platani JCM 14648]OAS18065.1 ABC transporter permease [Methylobacterium platani]
MPVAANRRHLLGGLAAASVAPLLPRPARAATPPIRIGVLTDMAGPYSEDSGRGSVVAAQLAIEDFARIDPGLRVELISGDMQGKPDVASALASAWYDRDGIDLIVDLPVSSAALAVAHVARQKDKAAILNPGTSDLSGKACSPNHVHWAFDTYALANSTGRAILAGGGRSWYFVQADYAFGAALAADTGRIVAEQGGTVKGTVRYPFPGTMDFASFLLQAQASGAQVVAFANAGADAANCIKQAGEFGLTQGGQKLASLLCFIPQIHGIGLQAAQGLLLTEGFYWDLNDRTRAFSKRYGARMDGQMPCTIQVGCYSGVLHYLKAVAAMGVEAARASGAAAVRQMKQIPTDDDVFGQGRVREDGRKIHDMHLFEVKTPAQSTSSWDLYRLVRTTPGEQAFRPLAEGQCPMVRS